MIASMNPRSSITSASSVYMTPMRLWSTLVIHSRHRYGHQPLTLMSVSTAAIEATTKMEAASGIGWLSGKAVQLSLPSTSVRHTTGGIAERHTHARLCGRDRIAHHRRLEQLCLDSAEGRRW